MSMRKFKKGAASFYIVAFSTLILMIVAISFATVIISEVERTSNDDLAQSAYDSALAGIEDAKLAYFNYQNCLAQEDPNNPIDESGVTCVDILRYMDEANDSAEGEEVEQEIDCQIVWKMLGRSSDAGGKVVEVTNGVVENNMQQATTCLTMTNETPDYRGGLSSSSMVDVIRLSFADGISADDIGSMSLKWFSKEDAAKANKLNYPKPSTKFPASSTSVATPPVVSLTVLQTGPQFTMDQFNEIDGDKTNRGTLYFIPEEGGNANNSISVGALAKSNDKTRQNNPYNVGCVANNDFGDKEFACSVNIDLPKPIGGVRGDNTFEIIVSMPYGQPETEFLLAFYCGNSKEACKKPDKVTVGSNGTALVDLRDVQIEVDSTGRANDLYRRVITRLKNNKSDLALSVMGPLELLDSGSSDEAGLTKNLTVTKEYNFKP